MIDFVYKPVKNVGKVYEFSLSLRTRSYESIEPMFILAAVRVLKSQMVPNYGRHHGNTNARKTLLTIGHQNTSTSKWHVFGGPNRCYANFTIDLVHKAFFSLMRYGKTFYRLGIAD